MIKKLLVFLMLILIASGIAWSFWQQEAQYVLPTPVPTGYKPIAFDQKLDLSAWYKNSEGKPLFVHFFNPYCPCSKFNTPYFVSLSKQYGSKVKFLVVVPEGITEEETRDFVGNDLEIIIDTVGMLASAAGVYSTPQAVIIDEDNLLYYRGNYNKSRYCSAKESNYAEIALQSLLNNQIQPTFDPWATTAYGCLFSKN